MSQAVFEVRRPGDGAVVGSLPVTDERGVGEAIRKARTAQRAWAARTPRQRAKAMGRLARVMTDRGDEIAACIRSETGKPLTEALAEIVVSVDLIRFYERVAPRFLAPRRAGSGWLVTKSASVEREPYGVVGGITPWNYPLVLPLDCLAPALFCGNAIVLKPSEFTPLTSLLLPDLVAAAGMDPDLVQVVTGDGATGSALVRGGVDRVVFTGSTATGRKVMEAAADTLTPVTLELGGKDPAIVLEDADLDRAAAGVTFGGFFNAGQTCISVERVFVVRPVYDAFVARVLAHTSALRFGVGDGVDVGPIITPAQLATVRSQLADALARGARAVPQRTDSGSSQDVIPPTVLLDVTDDMAVLGEETFGPLLPIVAVADENEAVERANDGAYGLFASVWTRDRDRGLRVARRLRAGGVSINDVLGHYGVPSLPVGGVGASGFGRRRGVVALDEMTRLKTVLVDRAVLRREAYWFPYTEWSEALMRGILEWRGRGGVGRALKLLGRFVGRRGRP